MVMPTKGVCSTLCWASVLLVPFDLGMLEVLLKAGAKGAGPMHVIVGEMRNLQRCRVYVSLVCVRVRVCGASLLHR